MSNQLSNQSSIINYPINYPINNPINYPINQIYNSGEEEESTVMDDSQGEQNGLAPPLPEPKNTKSTIATQTSASSQNGH